jgi:prepilin-type N-terminal cleavage/methylation domain-containing protein
MLLPLQPPLRRLCPRFGRARGGFSLVEMMLVMVVLTVAVSMLSSFVASTASMGPLQLQNAIASEAARAQLELMRTHSAGQIFALFNDEPDDDPAGSGTAPGGNFFVPGLTSRLDDLDGLCGRIRFPTLNGGLNESIIDARLGMPRDLDLNGVLDALPVDTTYRILPVEIVIEWQYGETVRSYSIYTMFVRQ